MEELAVVRVWADRVLQDAQSAFSVLTDEMLNCIILLLHKGGDTSDKPSDWRPIGLLNVGMQLVCVYYCRTFYKAVRVGEEESGGHVL